MRLYSDELYHAQVKIIFLLFMLMLIFMYFPFCTICHKITLDKTIWTKPLSKILECKQIPLTKTIFDGWGWGLKAQSAPSKKCINKIIEKRAEKIASFFEKLNLVGLADAQADFSLRCALMSEDTFSHVAVEMCNCIAINQNIGIP